MKRTPTSLGIRLANQLLSQVTKNGEKQMARIDNFCRQLDIIVEFDGYYYRSCALKVRCRAARVISHISPYEYTWTLSSYERKHHDTLRRLALTLSRIALAWAKEHARQVWIKRVEQCADKALLQDGFDQWIDERREEHNLADVYDSAPIEDLRKWHHLITSEWHPDPLVRAVKVARKEAGV